MTDKICTNCRHFYPVIGECGVCEDRRLGLRNYTADACEQFDYRVPRLHSVKEQMPRFEGYYFVYRRNGLPPEVLHYDSVHGFGYWDGVDNTPVDDVTHWMVCPLRPMEG